MMLQLTDLFVSSSQGSVVEDFFYLEDVETSGMSTIFNDHQIKALIKNNARLTPLDIA